MFVQNPLHPQEQEAPEEMSEKRARFSPKGWQAFVLGLGLTIILGVIAFLLSPLPVLAMMGSLTIALILGLIWRVCFGLPQSLRGGVRFSAQKVLRCGIILTGVRLNFQLIAASGIQILLLDILLIAFGLIVLPYLGRRLGLTRHLALLLGVGQSICGASAVGAISALLPTVEEGEISLAVALCGLVGTLGVLLYAFAQPLLHLSAHFYGILSGSTLQDIAQVVAAGPVAGSVSTEIGLLTKLTRVMLLAPVALLLTGIFTLRAGKQTRGVGEKRLSLKNVPLPWFVFGFLAVGALNSLGWLPKDITDFVIQASTFLMAMAMAAMGLQVDLSVIRRTGLKALLVSTLSLLLFIGLSSLLISLLRLG